jgi:SAM-dependent methyltransferase
MTVSHEDRLTNERLHGAFLSTNPEKYWGHGSLAGRLRVERRVKLFLERARIENGMRICEIGCGTGIFTKLLLKHSGAKIVGIDISPDLLAIAEREVSDTRVSFVLGDCMKPESLDIPLEFDAVITNSVLHHLDITKALPAVFDMLRQGGVFVCSEPNMMNPQIALQKNISWIKKLAGDSPDETAFFRWQIARYLSTVGFVDVFAEPFDFLHPSIPDFLAERFDRLLSNFERIPLVREVSGSLLIGGKKP